jgi:glutaredoxin
MSFTVYSKHGCPYCDRVKAVLDSVSINKAYPVIYYDLGSHFSKEQFYEEFGEGATFPQVVFNTKHLGGCTDTVKFLKENNLL